MPRTVPFEVEPIVAALAEDAYVVVENVLDADRVAAIKGDLERILTPVPYGRNAFEGFGTKRIYSLFRKTRMFDDLAIHPVMLGVLDAVLGSVYQSARRRGSRSAPATQRRSSTATTRSTHSPSRTPRS